MVPSSAPVVSTPEGRDRAAAVMGPMLVRDGDTDAGVTVPPVPMKVAQAAQNVRLARFGVPQLQHSTISDGVGDGDGDTAEGIAGEADTIAEALYAAMQDYAANTEGVDNIVYDSHAYPYFFNDAGERYATWTPSLLRAAYNYQYYQKDPGAFAHNGKYLIQVLYDSLAEVDGDVSGMTRP